MMPYMFDCFGLLLLMFLANFSKFISHQITCTFRIINKVLGYVKQALNIMVISSHIIEDIDNFS